MLLQSDQTFHIPCLLGDLVQQLFSEERERTDRMPSGVQASRLQLVEE